MEDMGSKNGVCINDKKIEKAAPLKDSDEIALGAVKLVFIDPTASMLGKLDDIPLFQQARSEEEVAAEAEAAASDPAWETGPQSAEQPAPSGDLAPSGEAAPAAV